MQSMKSVSPDVYEKTEGQTDKQTNKQTNKLEGYSRHSRQQSLNNSHLRLDIANIYKVRILALKLTEKMLFSQNSHTHARMHAHTHTYTHTSIISETIIVTNYCYYRPIWHRC